MAKKPTEIVPIQVRVREGLRRQLETAARKQGRSLNSEIVSRLQSSFSKDDREALLESAAERAADKALAKVMPHLNVRYMPHAD